MKVFESKVWAVIISSDTGDGRSTLLLSVDCWKSCQDEISRAKQAQEMRGGEQAQFVNQEGHEVHEGHDELYEEEIPAPSYVGERG